MWTCDGMLQIPYTSNIPACSFLSTGQLPSTHTHTRMQKSFSEASCCWRVSWCLRSLLVTVTSALLVATRSYCNKCIASSNECLISSNKDATRNKCIASSNKWLLFSGLLVTVHGNQTSSFHHLLAPVSEPDPQRRLWSWFSDTLWQRLRWCLTTSKQLCIFPHWSQSCVMRKHPRTKRRRRCKANLWICFVLRQPTCVMSHGKRCLLLCLHQSCKCLLPRLRLITFPHWTVIKRHSRRTF